MLDKLKHFNNSISSRLQSPRFSSSLHACSRCYILEHHCWPPLGEHPGTPPWTPPEPPATFQYAPLRRQLHQLGLFLAGAGFLAASVAVSRRAVVRRRLEALPAFHTCNRSSPAADASDRFGLATQALGLATLNVGSFGVLLTGGIAWGFDLCSVAELRFRTQQVLRRSAANVDPEAEREMEEAMASLLHKFGLDAAGADKSAASGAEDHVSTDK
ncbi:hypothetical protein L249_8227 [Ophiocordyceps polyrhachis-furcata BCC 54312]|uniref:Altered inheritance of mitochondria protein 11 n=1 Tax=Ophiocordyceps polyrhachis-furcata BCC 54312 TaxID=1330021 RepID=A0A367LHK0_9HYPO|nr:hypothetical protein L249_8227 [Ophiocordyceps polyrhachis-furcata BCC 54312]